MYDKLVSVVIPTHSGSDIITRAVDSVLAQTYKEVEVIVVDDNGLETDEQKKTSLAMQKYADNNNVHYIAHKVSKHGAAARNTGIKNSKGEYIAFLDDDDYFKTDNIENHVNALKSQSAEYGISYCGMKLIRKGFRDEYMYPKYEGDALLDFLTEHIQIGSSQIMVTKAVIDETNGFDESFKRHQDWEFIARTLHKFRLVKVDSIGVVKINLDRNIPKNPERYEANRLYYLDKLKYIIDEFPAKQQKQIYAVHYFDIAKDYLKAKNIKKFIYWTVKTRKPLKSFCKYIHDGFIYNAKRDKK